MTQPKAGQGLFAAIRRNPLLATVLGGTAVGAGAVGMAAAGQAMAPAGLTPEKAADLDANQLHGMLANHPGLKPEELAMYAGIRQGLISGEITDSDVYKLAAANKLAPNTLSLLSDIMDYSTGGLAGMVAAQKVPQDLSGLNTPPATSASA